MDDPGEPASVLDQVFTEPFEVMSAKKFPGMLDPTPLSKAFAKQGFRIPTVSQMSDGQLSALSVSRCCRSEKGQLGNASAMPVRLQMKLTSKG